MTFKPENFRRLSDANHPSFKIRNVGTLILVKATGEALYARGRGEKDDMVARYVDGADLLLWPWVGEFHTDVFVLDARDIKKYYE